MGEMAMKEALQHYLKAVGASQKVKQTAVIVQWAAQMGTAVSKRIEKKYIKDGVLYLELNSSAMRDELMQQRSRIVKTINQLAGHALIDQVFLM